MCCSPYINTNLFILGQTLLLLSFSTPFWQVLEKNQNGTLYTGYEGLWYRYIYHHSHKASCWSDSSIPVGNNYTDALYVRHLQSVRILLTASILFSFFLLALWCVPCLKPLREEFNNFCFAISILVTIVTCTLTISATILYTLEVLGTFPETHFLGHISYLSTIPATICFFFHLLTSCFKNSVDSKGRKIRLLIDFRKSFIFGLLMVIFLLLHCAYNIIPKHRRYQIYLGVVNLTLVIVMTVGYLGHSWTSVERIFDHRSVLIGLWEQCYDYQLTGEICCKDISNYYPILPKWLVICRNLATSAFSLGIVSLIFHCVLVVSESFQKPLYTVQVLVGIALLVSCSTFVRIIGEEEPSSRYGRDFYVCLSVSIAYLLLASLEILLYFIAPKVGQITDEQHSPSDGISKISGSGYMEARVVDT